MKKVKILILGCTGMLGSAVFRFLSMSNNLCVNGTVRSYQSISNFPDYLQPLLIHGVDVESFDSLVAVFSKVRPDFVINCVGVVKQHSTSIDVLKVIPINSIFPHRLANLCSASGARLVHISTDCVFSGIKGMYKEEDISDANDLYGRSKFLGELDYPHAITLRTSIIGHELEGARSLVDWFLSQFGSINGFTKAIFSGLPTVEIARIIRDYVMPNPHMHGVYHVSADPISKYDLLRLVASSYGKIIDIRKDDSFVINRSLDSSRFRDETGYQPKPWLNLVDSMKQFS